MKSRSAFALLLALAPVVAFAAPESLEFHADLRSKNAGACESRYGTIESIESSQAGNDSDSSGATAGKRHGAYFVRVRLDDRSYRTVAQIGLDDLRVGDGVQIGRGRVRRCDALSTQAGLPADTAGH